MPSLDLYLQDQYVGVVEPDRRDKSRVTLEVDQAYRQEFVLSESFTAIPGRRAPVDATSNFLGGYVPEGNHREAMAAKRRIDKGELFALLTEFGGSTAGAVTLRVPSEDATHVPSFEPLGDQELEAKLAQALSDSDQGIPEDSRSTLPGYQPKVLVALIDGRWVSPRGRAHSTHILKPQVPGRPSRIFDEHYSHLLAQRMGLSSYSSDIRTAGSATYLAIERFDRHVVEGDVRLDHQEDLAQALGLDWRDTDVKFQDPAWPTDPSRATAKRIAVLLGSIPRGDVAVEGWLRHLTFHVAIGNNDAHAKNVALIHRPVDTELAPLYDAVPNLFQDGLVKWDMALSIDGVFDHRRLSAERILDEARSWGLISSMRASEVVSATVAALDEALSSVTPPEGVSKGLAEQLAWNVGRLLAGTEIGQRRD